MTRLTFAYHEDPDTGALWADCDEEAGWSVAGDDLFALFALVDELVACERPGDDVDVRHRWANRGPATTPVLAVRIDDWRKAAT